MTSSPLADLCPTQLIGNTPVLWIDRPFNDAHSGFWAKLEGTNPGGMKDRTALHMIRAARDRGDLQPGARIIESTSGTLGFGLAFVGKTYGHPVTLVTDTGMEPLVVRLLRAYGADVQIVTTPHPIGGWQQARRDKVAELMADSPDAWCPDQYNNPDNVTAYTDLATELINQLGRIDTLVCSVGTGGHSAGVAQVLRQHNPQLRVVGVDATGSAIFGQPTTTRLMRGLGSSIHPRNVDYSIFDEVHWVNPTESVTSARAMAADAGTTGGWSVGAVGLVAGWQARTNAGEHVAAVFPDGPQRYFDTVFNDEWCAEKGIAIDAALPREPLTTPCPTQPATQWTRCVNVARPTPMGGICSA